MTCRKTVFSIIASVLLLLIPLNHFVGHGIVFSPDSHTYSHWADVLLSFHFHYSRYFHAVSFKVPPICYIAWVSVVALSKLCLGQYWAVGIVTLDFVIYAWSLLLILLLVKRYAHHASSWWIAVAVLLFAYDMYRWLYYMLSDISFMGLAFSLFCLFVVIAPFQASKLSLLKLLGVGALTLIGLFYRPAGVALVTFSLMSLLAVCVLLTADSFSVFCKRARWLLFAFLLFLLLAVGFYAFMMSHLEDVPVFVQHLFNVSLFSHYYRIGVVVMNRHDTYLPGSNTFLHCVQLIFVRCAYFFAVWGSYFSKKHALLNIVFFVPCYFFGLVAMGHLLFSNSHHKRYHWWITWLSTVFILTWVVCTAFNFMDHDWRYRLPCLPVLILMAGIGFDYGMEDFRRLFRKVTGL